jgi:hypothetical protein
MLKTHVETKTVEETVTDDILCNQCGGSCLDRCQMNYEGLIEVTVQGGYAAKLGDLVPYTFSLCEDCLKKLFEGFKIPPQGGVETGHGG